MHSSLPNNPQLHCVTYKYSNWNAFDVGNCWQFLGCDKNSENSLVIYRDHTVLRRSVGEQPNLSALVNASNAVSICQSK
jgi:hypothetical protein